MTPVPFEILARYPRLSWSQLLWGYDHGLIGWQTIAQLAKSRLSSEQSEAVRELANTQKSDAHRVGDHLRSLAPAPLGDQAKPVWAFLSLLTAYESDKSIEDKLAEVESIYSDFGYPAEVALFVAYMPSADDYRPELHSRSENDEHLLALWRDYLERWDKRVRHHGL
jgi:hypothetical protein